MPVQLILPIITRELRFYYKKYPDIFLGMLLDIWAHFTNRTVILYRHNEKQYCHYHCTVSLYGLCHNPYNMQVHVQWLWLTHNFALKKLLASNITLNYPEESKSGQGRRRWRQLFEGASANLSILLFAADFSLQFLRPFYLNLPAWHLDGMCNNFQIRPRSRAHSLTLSWKGLKKVSL